MTQSQASVAKDHQGLLELEQVAKALSSADNTARSSAETRLSHLKQHPHLLMPMLVQVIAHSSDLDVQLMCALVLRQCVQSFGEEASACVRAPLLELLLTADSNPAYIRIADVVSAMSTSVRVIRSWPELLPCLWAMLSSCSSRQHEAALSILDRIAEYDLDSLRPHLSNIWTLLAQVLSGPSASSGTRLAGLKTSISILVALKPAEAEELGSSPIPKLMLQSIALAQAEHDISGSLTALLELVGSRPTLFLGIIPDVVNAMTSVANSVNLETSTRRLALEMLLSLCESGPEIRRNECLLQSALQISMNLLLDVDDDWNSDTSSGDIDEQHEDEEEDSPFAVGSSSISRIAASNGVSVLLGLCGTVLAQWCSDNDWKKRQAALMAIAYICDGCSSRQARQLSEMFVLWAQMVHQSCADKVARVRYAGLELLSMMCGGFEGEFQRSSGQNFLQILCTVLNDPHPRVLEQAGLCLAVFCAGLEDSSEEHALVGAEDVLRILAGQLSQPASIGISRLESCLTGIASLSQAMGSRFAPFYDNFMPKVRAILLMDRATPHLVGKALECVGLMGAAVGKDRFEGDGCDLVRHMLAMNVTPEQEHYTYVQQTLARVSQTVRESFAVFLPSIIPGLLRSAALKDGVSVQDIFGGEAEEAEDGVDVVDVQLRGVGTRRIRLNTSIMEEKALACNMLYQYAHDLGATFAPYAKQVAEVLLPLAEHRFNEQVRLAAVAALPALVSSLQTLEPAAAHELAISSIASIVKAIGSEPDVYSIMLEVEAAADTIEAAQSRLGFESERVLCSTLSVLVEESMERRAQRNETLRSPHADQQVHAKVEEENAAETELVGHVVDCVQKLVQVGKDTFVDTFHKKLSKQFQQMLETGRSDDEVTSGLCVFDELLEHGGSRARQLYYSTMLPLFLSHSQSGNPSLRQSAVYGIGVCAETGRELFEPVASETAVKLLQLVNQEGSRSDEAGVATDNAISALGKIMCFHSRSVNMEQLWPQFLRLLPCVHDTVEAKVVHKYFVKLLMTAAPTLCSSSCASFPDVVGVVATLLLSQDDICEDETNTALSQVWRELICQQLPQASIQQLLQNLGLRPDQVASLMKC